MLDNREMIELKNNVDYALNGAKLNVRYGKEFVDKSPTESNMEFLRKAEHNMGIVEECNRLLNDLILDEDSDEET